MQVGTGGRGLGFLRISEHRGSGDAIAPMMLVKEGVLGTAYGGHQGLWGVPSSGCLTKCWAPSNAVNSHPVVNTHP